MDANEFWCRAFLATMGGVYTEHADSVGWENHGAPTAYCEKAADAALAVAQRRGMVAGPRESAGPTLERVEFTANYDQNDLNLWWIGVHEVGVFRTWPGSPMASLGENAIRIKWSESVPPKPTDVWIERRPESA